MSIAAMERGVVLGGDQPHLMSTARRAYLASLAVRKAKAKARATNLLPIIAELRAAGITSATGIARCLTERSIPTARGSERWTTVQVQRVLARLSA
jgi:hypothetical protein